MSLHVVRDVLQDWAKLRRWAVVGAAVVVVLLSAVAGASAAELYGSVSAGGKRQASVAVELVSGKGSVAKARTSSNGTYRFRNIPPGNYRIRAAGGEWPVYVGPGINRYNVAK
jgi:hypothetical protein